jgi:2-polyprenyl-3-methyl-5-hydroxy-6-metoxy-1,4-benzoquinol methylase
MNAVDFHSDIAQAFGDRYQQSADFKERFQVWTRLLDRYAQPGQRVLDAGCGTGVFSYYLANRGCLVTGIDGSAAMIRICQQQPAPVVPIQFRQGLLPLAAAAASEPFDIILSSSVLEYVPDLMATWQSFADQLRTGGYLIVSLPNRQSVYRHLERAGFWLTNRPAYLTHVLHYSTAISLAKSLKISNLLAVENQTYGGSNACARLLRTCLPAPFADTLFVAVFQKN